MKLQQKSEFITKINKQEIKWAANYIYRKAMSCRITKQITKWYIIRNLKPNLVYYWIEKISDLKLNPWRQFRCLIAFASSWNFFLIEKYLRLEEPCDFPLWEYQSKNERGASRSIPRQYRFRIIEIDGEKKLRFNHNEKTLINIINYKTFKN